MNNLERDVVKALDIPIDQEEIEFLQGTHAYISDKLILDAVNGVNVVARRHHKTSLSRQSGFNRLWDGITGRSKQRQDFIDKRLIEGLSACTRWLRDHDRHMSRIDNRIIDVANELDRTQDEILKFFIIKYTIGEVMPGFCIYPIPDLAQGIPIAQLHRHIGRPYHEEDANVIG